MKRKVFILLFAVFLMQISACSRTQPDVVQETASVTAHTDTETADTDALDQAAEQEAPAVSAGTEEVDTADASGEPDPSENADITQASDTTVISDTSEALSGESADVSETSDVTSTDDTASEEAEVTAGYIPEDPSAPPGAYDFTICFAGDINLAEGMPITAHLDEQEDGIHGCISEKLLEEMNAADIMCLNNEFTFSTRGTPADKTYTFRADPSRVSVLLEMGTDVVTLANNHVYDYRREAFEDTLQTLTDAGIPYFGAGMNREEAMRPVFVELQGKRIAFVAATRAEKYIATPEATEDSPGVLRCYDPTLFVQTIQSAREQADFVIAVVHWGTEYSTVLEEDQLVTGKLYLDSGADIVIGAHSHCLQGMEYYNGKPIIYSLGNYWFNEKTLDTMLLKVHFFGDAEHDSMQVEIIPAIQSGFNTTYVEDYAGQRRIFDYLESISINTAITDDGILYEK